MIYKKKIEKYLLNESSGTFTLLTSSDSIHCEKQSPTLLAESVLYGRRKINKRTISTYNQPHIQMLRHHSLFPVARVALMKRLEMEMP